jgi:hypothetical protein
MKHKTAIKLASNWHGGQWSALYQFASSGEYLIENHLRYLREIEDNLHPEYNLHPGTLSKKNESDLNGMKSFFIGMGEKHGIKTEYHDHPIYGFPIPFISEDTPFELANTVKALKYLA